MFYAHAHVVETESVKNIYIDIYAYIEQVNSSEWNLQVLPIQQCFLNGSRRSEYSTEIKRERENIDVPRQQQEVEFDRLYRSSSFE